MERIISFPFSAVIISAIVYYDKYIVLVDFQYHMLLDESKYV